MPVFRTCAVGLVLVPRWSGWNELSHARITLGAFASRSRYALIDTFAVTGVAFVDDLAVLSLCQLVERCSAGVLLVTDDVPQSYVTSVRRRAGLVVSVAPGGLLSGSGQA